MESFSPVGSGRLRKYSVESIKAIIPFEHAP